MTAMSNGPELIYEVSLSHFEAFYAVFHIGGLEIRQKYEFEFLTFCFCCQLQIKRWRVWLDSIWEIRLALYGDGYYKRQQTIFITVEVGVKKP